MERSDHVCNRQIAHNSKRNESIQTTGARHIRDKVVTMRTEANNKIADTILRTHSPPGEPHRESRFYAVQKSTTWLGASQLKIYSSKVQKQPGPGSTQHHSALLLQMSQMIG